MCPALQIVDLHLDASGAQVFFCFEMATPSFLRHGKLLPPHTMGPIVALRVENACQRSNHWQPSSLLPALVIIASWVYSSWSPTKHIFWVFLQTWWTVNYHGWPGGRQSFYIMCVFQLKCFFLRSVVKSVCRKTICGQIVELHYMHVVQLASMQEYYDWYVGDTTVVLVGQLASPEILGFTLQIFFLATDE